MGNYFSLLNMPETYNLDMAVLKRNYYKLSRQSHPDALGKMASTDVSTTVNAAYEVLRDPEQRLAYLLELKGSIKKGETYQLDSMFLMTMLEKNEEIEDARGNPLAIEALSLDLDDELAENEETIVLEFSNDNVNYSLIKELYYQRKYLKRLKGQLK